MTRLVQLERNDTRRVAIVEEPNLRLLRDCSSIYQLAESAVAAGSRLSALAHQKATDQLLDYESIYSGRSEWRLLLPIDHPAEPARCLVSGTGLTHLGSAANRQAMHELTSEQLTDSMRMFRWGLEGGTPTSGTIGTPPEWFYKGNGTMLHAHGEPLEIPPYAEDGGEEAEVAGIYWIASDGKPMRVGMAIGNEFSDHQFEKKNYLNLAGSKLRTCALGPELILNPQFESVPANVSIARKGATLWSKSFLTGQSAMCHSLQNIEHHHFKFELHRRPGDVHVHFFGTASLSFSDGVQLQEGDVMQVTIEGFGRPLRNPVRTRRSKPELVVAVPLG
jgi:hypothetical protein